MSTSKLKKMLLAVSMLVATLATATAAFLVTPASALGPDTGTSNAYGINVKLLGGNLLGPVPAVTLGTDGSASSLTSGPVGVLGLISAQALTSSTSSTNFGTAAETINASATTANLSALGLLGSTLQVGAIHTSCASSDTGSVGSTTITSLKIAGTAISLPSPIPANTSLTGSMLGVLDGIATITLNAQTTQDRNDSSLQGTSLQVIGLQVTLLSGLDSGAAINVSESSCEATGSDIEAVPSVSSVTPGVGPAAGGTIVTIEGAGFVPASGVAFNGVAATNVVYVNATQLTATSPADSGIVSNTTVPVTVSNPYGSGPSSPGPANDFTYEVSPDPSAPLTPDSGPVSGGQSFSLGGTNLGPDTTVAFGTGSNLATSVVISGNGDSLTGVTPPHSVGVVNVIVTDTGGTSTLTNGYTYVSPSVSVTSVTPDIGPIAGGTSVTIDGSGFTGATAASVLFGSTAAQVSGFSVNGPGTVITATAPAHAVGTVDITVNNGSATSPAVLADQFTFEGTPIITSSGLSPSAGPVSGGTQVTITGTGFGADSTVSFGTNSGTHVAVAASGTSLTVDAPASTTGAGDVNVAVADAGGTSNTESFDYIASPVVNSSGGIVPASGPEAGGTAIQINGSNFTNLGTTTVTVSGNEATSVAFVSPTELTAVTPAGVVGPANVVVTDIGGSSPPQTFTYVAPPDIGVAGLSPAFGKDVGGTTVTLTGSGLSDVSAVDFGGICTTAGDSGGTAGTSVTPISDTSATVVTPSHADGATIVCVTSAGGTAEAAEEFTFEPAPSISALTTSGLLNDQGPVPGGTSVTITGTGFGVGDPATVVDFGGSPATDVVVVSPTEITAVSPPSPLPSPGIGPVNVTVSDAGGGPATAPERFTYVAPPVVSGVSPTSGPQGGGKPVVIKGSDLCNVVSVLFGGTSAAVVSVSSDCTTLTVTAPPGSGTVSVVVKTSGGSAVAPESFTYIQPGYWETAADGGVFAFGGAEFFGSVPGVLQPGQQLNLPIVAMADTPDHGGYWLFAADGGVFSFGDAGFFGSVPGVLVPEHRTLNGPIVSAEATPDGGGYRLFAADGGVFDFGDAVFEGALPGLGIKPPAPIEGATTYPFGQGANPNNAGYWLIGADGAVYAFGNAPFVGSTPGALPSTVVSLATTPDGEGYYVFSKNGAVSEFGDALTGLGGPSSLNAPIVFGQATSTGKGYWEFASDGGVFAYGDAPFEGSLGSLRLNAPITAGIAFGST